jgi:hypothetical protein
MRSMRNWTNYQNEAVVSVYKPKHGWRIWHVDHASNFVVYFVCAQMHVWPTIGLQSWALSGLLCPEILKLADNNIFTRTQGRHCVSPPCHRVSYDVWDGVSILFTMGRGHYIRIMFKCGCLDNCIITYHQKH